MQNLKSKESWGVKCDIWPLVYTFYCSFCFLKGWLLFSNLVRICFMSLSGEICLLEVIKINNYDAVRSPIGELGDQLQFRYQHVVNRNMSKCFSVAGTIKVRMDKLLQRAPSWVFVLLRKSESIFALQCLVCLEQGKC